ncbi:MAG TPA: nucleotidyltransferase family protein [Ramlibacter sp.]|nr:nucleotidyltransferase family protein [Ramlibacter sp.]
MPSTPVEPTSHDLICAALRGENPHWPWPGGDAASQAVLAVAEIHGIDALLHQQLAGRPDWPDGLLRTLRGRAMQGAMWELHHQQVMNQTLAALHDAGVHPILIKGTALAYSIYPDPMLRKRGDTDLLVPAAARHKVHEVLLSLGFTRSLGVTGEYVSYQASYIWPAAAGGVHALDLHWKINNSEVLSRLFSYDELRRDGMPLPLLGPHARGPSLVDSMLIACMHRATHRTNPYYVQGEAHHDPDRLIWLADIHLLAARLTGAEWDALIAAARAKGLRAITLDGLQCAHASWHTEIPDFVRRALGEASGAEAASTYLQSRRLRQQWLDFRALQGPSAKLRFLRETMFPAADYMRAKFNDASTPLAFLHLRRVTAGLAARLGRK